MNVLQREAFGRQFLWIYVVPIVLRVSGEVLFPNSTQVVI